MTSGLVSFCRRAQHNMNAARKVLIVVIVGSVILIGIYTQVSQHENVGVAQYIDPVYQNTTRNLKYLNNNNESKKENSSHTGRTMKVILYWTPMFGELSFYLGLGQKIFENCTYKNCYATHDKNYMPVEKFDAIVFHGVEYTERRFGKPTKRHPEQIYIFSNQESPVNTPSFLANYNNFYNWTMTYRLDSDILRSYGFLEKNETGYQPPSAKEIQNRPNKIAWFVSNCHTQSKRETLYHVIRKYIHVDVYGECGDMKCSRKSSVDCYNLMEAKYKFYLSFENSICEDYVTEKLYNVLKKNIVPVVYGGADYDTLAPPKSVINVMDFESVKDLVQYIKFLDTYPQEYLKYFEWKKNYIIDTSSKLALCGLCQKLNEPIKRKIYSNLDVWWRGPNSDKCYNNVVNKFT